MERTEQGEDPLEELEGHEVGGGQGALEVVEAVGQEGVESIGGGRGRLHGWLNWVV